MFHGGNWSPGRSGLRGDRRARPTFELGVDRTIRIRLPFGRVRAEKRLHRRRVMI